MGMELLQRRVGVECADTLGGFGIGHHGIAAQAVAQQGATVHQVESEGQEGKACKEKGWLERGLRVDMRWLTNNKSERTFQNRR